MILRIAKVTALSLTAVVWVLVTTSSATAQAGSSRQPLTETERAVHLLSRTTYGVRPADVDEVLRLGRDGWLDAQMQPALSAEVEQPQPAPPADGQSALAIMAGMEMALDQVNGPTELTYSKLTRAVQSERQLEEVMTDFWFNHFNVSVTKSPLNRRTIENYEQTAIRALVFGRFQEMLLATARHPAMLMYLDNFLSSAPATDSITSLRRGLNENYARELLELHTLGVDGGYSQQDVIEVARAFTGWGVPTRLVGGAQGTPQIVSDLRNRIFLFDIDRHDQGQKVVLGRPLAGGRGAEDGLDVLEMLARHPSTARHVATKLVQHFVADEPPPDLVEEITRVFLATDGDLREVTRALFTSDAFYRPEYYRAKAKRPFEFVASAFRLTGADLQGFQPSTATPTDMPSLRVLMRERSKAAPLQELLDQMQHAPYSEPSPAGYPSSAEEWMSAGALLDRMNFAVDFAFGRFGPSGTLDPFRVLGLSADSAASVLQAAPGQPASTASLRSMTDMLLRSLLIGTNTSGLAEAIVQDLSRRSADDPAALVSRALGLALGSAQFQRY